MRRVVVLLAVLASVAGALTVGAAPATAAAADLVVSQTSLDFGDTRMGTTSPFRTATVTNRGSAAVTLSGGYGSTPKFVQAGTCKGATLAPGATCTLTFLFRPPRDRAAPAEGAGCSVAARTARV